MQNRKYICINQFLGKCPQCRSDIKNIYCSDFFPVHVIGAEAIIPPRDQKEYIISIMLKNKQVENGCNHNQ